MSEQYVKSSYHGGDHSRLERKIESLETTMNDSMQDVAEKLDRNYEQIRSGIRR